MTSSWEPQQPHNRLLTSLKLSREFNPRYLRPHPIRNPAVNFDFQNWAINPLPKRTLEYIKGEVLLQLLNKSQLRNGIKMFLEPKFFSICSQI